MSEGSSAEPTQARGEPSRGGVGLDDALRVPAHVAFRAVEGELVVLDLERGRYYGLNQVGARAWALVLEEGTPRRVWQTMADEYAVAPEVLADDLLDLFGALVGERLLMPAQ